MNQKKKFKEDEPVSILMPVELQRAVYERAKNQGRSFGAEVRQVLKRDLGFIPAETAEEKQAA